MTVLELLQAGLGEKPSKFVKCSKKLGMNDAQKIMEAFEAASGSVSPPRNDPVEIWPLISHHGFNRASIFGLGERGDVHQKTLTLLLAHDGLVASNPLVDVASQWRAGQRLRALNALNVIIDQVSAVEPIIEEDILRFVSTRPALTDNSRNSLLQLFGLTSEMMPFQYLENLFMDVQNSPATYGQKYLHEIANVFTYMDLVPPPLASVDAGREATISLARALIYVSWQLAVCADNPHCDLALTHKIEHQVFDKIIFRSMDRNGFNVADEARGKTRYVKRLSIGEIPNLDSVGLSASDAVAIRKNDAFENFRKKFRGAMHELPASEVMGQEKSEAEAEFIERMQEAAKDLKESTKKSSLNKRLKDFSAPASLGICSSAGFAALNGDITSSIFTGAASGGALMLGQWLKGRKQIDGSKVAVRYFSSLGGMETKRL